MSRPDPEQLQGTLVDFALLELIRQHRESFQPLWTVDSWAKLMIWLSLNCGLSGERDALEHFAAALGERITSRLRRTFFERELADLELQVLADPAEQQVLVLLLLLEILLHHGGSCTHRVSGVKNLDDNV